MFISGGRVEPREYDLKEYWTWKGTGQPPWFVRAIQSRRFEYNSSGPKPEESGHQHDDVEGSVFGSHASHANSSTKEHPVGIAEQPILSRATPEPISRLSHQ